MQIEYVNHGIGNHFGDVIELNENLKEFPNLHQAILEHELGHTDRVFTKQDFVADLTEYKVSKIELLKFMFKHPRSFSQFLPFYWTKKYGFVYDINLIIIYLILFSVIGTSIYLAFLL